MSEVTPVEIVDESSAKLSVVVRESGLEVESAKNVLETFVPLLKQADEWRKKVAGLVVTDVSQVAEMKLARDSRLALKEIRVNAEKARKRLKEDSLRRGKAIDGAYNIVEFIIAPLEKELQAQEDFVKNKELERKAALKEARSSVLVPLLLSPHELVGLVLEDMTPETFQQLVDFKQAASIARAEGARRIEADRIAREHDEAVERERIRVENERLKAEAAEKEKALQAERARVDRERAEAAEATRQENLRQQALREVERQKAETERKRIEAEKAELQRKADAEKAALQKKLDEAAAIERTRKAEELEKARLEAEARAKQAEAERKAAAAPDKEKLLAFITTIRAVSLPEVASADAGFIRDKARIYIRDLTGELERAVNNL